MVIPASISNKMLSTRLKSEGVAGCSQGKRGSGAVRCESKSPISFELVKTEDYVETAARAPHTETEHGFA
jgi:hypothetical protein